MASVVTDVLNSAGVLVKEDIVSKVSSFKRKIEGLKLEVQEILKNSYIDFIPQYVKLDQLTESLNTAKTEYETLHCHIEKEIKPQMSASVTEYNEMFEDIKKITVLKQSVVNIISLHKHLEAVKIAHNEESYRSAMDHLFEFEKMFASLSPESKKDIEILVALKKEQIIAKNKLIHFLQEYFKQGVSVTKTDVNKKYLFQTLLTIQTSPKQEFREVVYCLKCVNELRSTLRSFAKTFVDLVCCPIMTHCTEVEYKVLDEKTTLMVSVLRDSKSDPVAVLNNFSELFNNVHSMLCGWLQVDNKNDENLHNDLVVTFGNLIKKDFCHQLVEQCLRPAIPSQSSELESFQAIIKSAINFHNILIEHGFFDNSDNMLKEFIENVNEMPSKKMALDFLSRARTLMKSELYQTITVGTKEQPLDSTDSDDTGELSDIAHTKSGLSRLSFSFPSCHISVFARDLVKLLYQMMKEAKAVEERSPHHSLKLFVTARDICELYCCVVPTYHKEQISNIPQQTAIHHNNCMYIAHCLLTAGLAKYSVDTILPVTFVDLVPKLRELGTEAFLAQMRTQRQHILQLLKDPEAFQNIAQDDNLMSNAKNIVNQCLQQLEFLKRVWSDVLPIHVYFKAIGTLLNTCLEEIISRIVSMEDIAAQSAAQLDSVFGIILKQSPELFNIPRGNQQDSVHKYVRRWFRFQELQLVLSANLQELVDRWSSGKGPLASHFTADEVKHLIRALFQNTERRAAALGKIR